MRLFANANYDFLGRRKVSLTLSGVVLAALLVVSIFWQFSRGSWLNYNVDFTGGTLVQIHFDQPTSVGELRDVVGSAVPGTEITRFGAENEYLFRAPAFSEEGTAVSDQIVQVLGQRYAADAFEVVRTEAVGPKVGGELQQKAIIAIVLSLLATLVYLALRFEWRFGVAAVGATAHDMLLALLLVSALRLDVSLTTVAALLTIIGYSLNDKIIVFDRIRENIKGAGRKQENIEIFNRSINETLPRTVLTSGTTVATLLALAIVGTGAIQEFALILIAGIVIGTYSSIFVASPILYYIERRWPRGEKKATAKRPRHVTA